MLLPADSIAVLGYAAQLDAPAPLLTCSDAETPAARLPKLQARIWLPTAPMMEHVPGPGYAGLMLQLMPVPAGSGSFKVTLVAVAVSAALLLAAVIV